MANRGFSSSILLLALVMGLMFLHNPSLAAGQSTESTAVADAMQTAASVLTGTWSGTFYSKHSDVAPFTMTVVISADSQGHLIGSSTLNSECLKGARLKVTMGGSTVVLAGSDPEGDNMTVRGTLDSTGTLLNAKYILNGSASGNCETDDGTGSLAKR